MKNYKGVLMAILCMTTIIAGCGKNTASSSTQVEEETITVEEEIPSISVNTETEEATENEEEIDEAWFIEDEYPVLDGSTSLKPLGIKMTSMFLNISEEEAEEKLVFHKTDDAYSYLLSNESDILIAAEGCDEVKEIYEEENFQYEIEPIAMEALVFVVNQENPVESLTYDQIKKIYSGKITNWSEVGGNDAEIIAFQRNEQSGSQVMMRKCVMTDTEMMKAPIELIPEEMGGLIEGVAGYDNSASAIGYTVYYYADSMRMADGLKIIKIDGVEPCNETIASGEYPFLNPYYCLIRKDENEGSPARIIYDWLVSDEGQQMVADSGYVPAKSLLTVLKREASEADKGGEIPIKRLKAEYMKEYVAGTATGCIYPILLQKTIGGYYDDTIYKYGFVDEDGTLLCDGVYSSVEKTDLGWNVRLRDSFYLITFDGKAVLPYRYDMDFDGKYYYYYEVLFPYTWEDLLDPETAANAYVEIKQTIYDEVGNTVSDRILNIDHSIQKDVLTGYSEDSGMMKLYLVHDSKNYLGLITDSLAYNPESYSDELLRSIYDVNKDKIIFSSDKSISIFENGTFSEGDFWGSEPSTYLLNCEGTKIDGKPYYSIDYLGNDCYSVKKTEDGNYFLYKLINSRFKQLIEFDDAYIYKADGFIEVVGDDLRGIEFYDFDGNEIFPEDNPVVNCWKKAFDILSTENEKANEWNSFEPSQDPITGKYYVVTRDGKIYDCGTGEKIYTIKPYEIPEPTDWNPNPYPRFRSVNLYNGIIINRYDEQHYEKPINPKTGESLFDYSIFIWENGD